MRREDARTIPTIGFNTETLTYKNQDVVVWGIGGQDKIRALWKHYCPCTDGFIFVIDSNDPTRFADASHELYRILNELDRAKALLVLVSKRDLPDAVSPETIKPMLELERYNIRHIVHATNAISGEGVVDAFENLMSILRTDTSSSPFPFKNGCSGYLNAHRRFGSVNQKLLRR
jgi:signal recognition particle receptor subunit beta